MTTTKFIDRKGRTWDVALDILKARQVCNSDFTAITTANDGKVNILRPDKDTFARVLLDPQLLAAVCWVLVQDQVAKQPELKWPTPNDGELAELEFVSGFGGTAILAAREALCEALADFFPDLRIALFALMKQLRNMDEKVGRKIEETMPMLDEMMEEAFNAGVEKMREEILGRKSTTAGGTSTSSPPMLVSSPISGNPVLPSGNS